MGQISRMARADRYRQAFEEMLLPSVPLTGGENCKISKIFLAPRDEDEAICAYALIEVFGGGEVEAIIGGPYFYPETDTPDDIIDNILNLQPEQDDCDALDSLEEKIKALIEAHDL